MLTNVICATTDEIGALRPPSNYPDRSIKGGAECHRSNWVFPELITTRRIEDRLQQLAYLVTGQVLEETLGRTREHLILCAA
jgi:hypothetical protein